MAAKMTHVWKWHISHIITRGRKQHRYSQGSYINLKISQLSVSVLQQ